MNKQECIRCIENLFPIDSDYADTNEVGERLLIKAIQAHNWRQLPESILHMYATLCRQEDTKQSQKTIY